MESLIMYAGILALWIAIVKVWQKIVGDRMGGLLKALPMAIFWGLLLLTLLRRLLKGG